MGQVIGEILPLAVTIAISPVPIIAVILMLFAPKAKATSAGFLVGWVVGILAVVLTATAAVGGAGSGSPSEPSALSSWVRLALGALLVVLSVRHWYGRPAPGAEPSLPGWMTAIDTFSAGKALGLGFLLAAINPKNFAAGVAAGVAIAQGALSGGGITVAVAVFTLVAAATVLVPVLAYAVAAAKVAGPLDRLKLWLEANNATVMAVLLLVIGVVLIGKGIGGL